jgi:hypothetical protein
MASSIAASVFSGARAEPPVGNDFDAAFGPEGWCIGHLGRAQCGQLAIPASPANQEKQNNESGRKQEKDCGLGQPSHPAVAGFHVF